MARTGSWAWGLIISYLSKSSPNKSITIIQYTHQGGGLFALLNLWCHVTDPYCPEHIYPSVTDRMTKIMTPVDIWYPTKIIIILWTCTVFYFNFLFPFFLFRLESISHFYEKKRWINPTQCYSTHLVRHLYSQITMKGSCISGHASLWARGRMGLV